MRKFDLWEFGRAYKILLFRGHLPPSRFNVPKIRPFGPWNCVPCGSSQNPKDFRICLPRSLPREMDEDWSHAPALTKVARVLCMSSPRCLLRVYGAGLRQVKHIKPLLSLGLCLLYRKSGLFPRPPKSKQLSEDEIAKYSDCPKSKFRQPADMCKN